uniref:Uncharacterized protein n=1 Tax=Strombidium inclinatum TaxID=197538 RepID=A0A7S3IHG4_9SPIT|mmetsp:Transcript_19365/g.29697  ORF Transcript_19365/g.29697 Transcript_19365/m.29697 type:complete len:100 (+) Transcript_19365:2-301(+)
MFRRDVKKQFNEAKYDYLVNKGIFQKTHHTRLPYGKQLVGTCALFITGFHFTKRYYTMPHDHKNTSEPMTMFDGDLHPFEHQPKKAAGMRVSKKHEMTD